jgi:ABC-2 type transport system ATP-binding protein
MAALAQQRGLFLVGLASGQAFPQEEVAKRGFQVKHQGELWELGLADGQSIDAVVDLLRARGLSIRHLVEKRQSLEEVFLATVEAPEPGVDQRPRGTHVRKLP